nr:hypothetical protein [Actinomadura formosensis]
MIFVVSLVLAVPFRRPRPALGSRVRSLVLGFDEYALVIGAKLRNRIDPGRDDSHVDGVGERSHALQSPGTDGTSNAAVGRSLEGKAIRLLEHTPRFPSK